jgi:hypothetical protein
MQPCEQSFRAAEVGEQAEVASHFQVCSARWVCRHLRSREVLGVQDPGVEIAQQLGELLDVPFGRVWDDVEILGHADEAVCVDGESADDDVLDAAFVQGSQQRQRVKRFGHDGTPWRSGWRTCSARQPPPGLRSRRVRDHGRPALGLLARCGRSPRLSTARVASLSVPVAPLKLYPPLR